MSKWDVQFIFLCIWTGLAAFRIGDQFLMNNARLRGRRNRLPADSGDLIFAAILVFGTAVGVYWLARLVMAIT